MPNAVIRRLLRYLLGASFAVGVVSTLSYATTLHYELRMTAPAFGAWWNRYEFYFMEGAATALGLLIALRVGMFFSETGSGRRAALLTLALDAVLLVPLTHLCAAAGRVGADATSAIAPERIASLAGYAAAKLLDKILIAGVYFVKTVGFAFLFGLGLFGAVVVGTSLSACSGGTLKAAQPSPADPR
jgi:hypothetical protein